MAEFLGEINMLPLSAVARDAQGLSGTFEDQRIQVRAPVGTMDGGASVLAIRPEHMTLRAAPDGASNALRAVATHATYQGAATKLDLATRSGTKLTLAVPSDQAAAALNKGNEVWLTWGPEQGFLMPREEPAPAA